MIATQGLCSPPQRPPPRPLRRVPRSLAPPPPRMKMALQRWRVAWTIVSFPNPRVPRSSSARAGFFCRRPHSRAQEYSRTFPSASGPPRLNLNCPHLSGRVMTETAPRPVLRFRHEPAPHRISVKIAQLLSKLSFTPDIEVVVTLLPERFLGPQGEPTCHALLQRFQRLRKRAALGFFYEQMHMLRHDDVSVHAEPERLPAPFQRGYEDCAGF